MTVIRWLMSADNGWYPARLVYVALPLMLIVGILMALWYIA